MSDEELGLAPIEDEDAAKTVAPDLPFDTQERLIPVICSACRTRLYAGESQVGLWKKCPDCGRLSEILAVPEKFMLVADDPEAAGGYGITGPAMSRREIFQLRAANQQRASEAAKEIARNLAENRLIASAGATIQEEETPVAERILNQLLKTKEEKDEERTAAEKEEKIRAESAAVNRAVREGKLEEHLAKSTGAPDDALSRKLAEKQRNFEAARQQAPKRPEFHPPPVSQPARQIKPPPVPSSLASLTPPHAHGAWETVPNKRRAVNAGSFFSPFWDARFRPRLTAILVTGLIGNFFGEKARSMVWQVVFDKVYEQYPGYVYTTWESVMFVGSFYVGAFFTAIWLTMLFLFGISLFLESASGKNRVENWSSFDLNFGCSYVFWSLLIFYVSGFPGFLVWQGASLLWPDLEASLIGLHYLGWFVCFPVLFLCVIESDTFFGPAPRRTLKSLRHMPGLWLKFYAASALVVGTPLTCLFALIFAGTGYYDSWLMNSVFYYVAGSLLLTFCGFFVLLYFQLLGRLAWATKADQPD